ncbi:MAG TPA: hypothetical protein VJ998_02175 [Pseudomonadales bacterium]|nr:hypothetical protein [Pseudomonadales bacterium]
MTVDGDWKVKMNSPMGAQEATLTLAADGGSLSGKIVGPQGTQEFTGGTVDGGNVAWKISLTQPMPMDLEFSGAVDGDAISGNVKLGAFGNATFEGTRA